MNRVLPLSRITRSTAKSKGIFVLALACSLTLSACASPVAPSAKPANFYEAVRSDVEKFWAGYFSSHWLGHTRRFRKCSYSTGRSSVHAVEFRVGPFYCPRTEGVYLESGFMQTDLSAFGDFGAAVIVAHEIGHHIQNLRGFNTNITMPRAS